MFDPPPDEFHVLVDRAKRSEGSAARKHHVVPRSYLQRWSDREQILVTDIESKSSYLSSPLKAARITDFYSLESEDLDSETFPPLLFETLLGDVESWGKLAIDQLLDESEDFGPDNAEKLACFMAFQFTRGATQRREMRFMCNELFKLQHSDLSDSGIRQSLARNGRAVSQEDVETTKRFLRQVEEGEVTVEPQPAALVGLAGSHAEAVSEQLLNRTWIVYETPRVLVTCDEPVVAVGGPSFPRCERAGVGDAGVILFPLSPDRLLVMMRDDLALAHGYRPGAIYEGDLDQAETVEICREIVMNAYRWAFERPRGRMAGKFQIPSSDQAVAVEEMGPIKAEGREGVLIRSFRPSRWAGRLGPSPWPVARWWIPSLMR